MQSFRQDFLSKIAQTSPEPLLLEIVNAEGCNLIDANNKYYLDLISGISVSNTGHKNKRIIKAVTEQINKYSHLMVYGEFVESAQTKFADSLLKLLPNEFENVYFVNSGSEAIEASIKLARKHTKRKKIIAFENAYHGSTTGAMSLMSSTLYTEPFLPLMPDVVHIPWDDTDALNAIDKETAAVFAEVVRSEAGYNVPSKGFLQKLRAQCDEAKALLVFDEIQSGFGRSGTFFAFEQENVVPDILCLAKALGGGLPLGALISSKEIMQNFMIDPPLGHITTFGGNAVCCAAGMAALHHVKELIADNKIFEKEKIFRELLKHDRIKDVSGKGLMLAVEFENEEINKMVIDYCISQGVMVDWFLFAPHKLRIAPPLIINEQEIIKACETILLGTLQNNPI